MLGGFWVEGDVAGPGINKIADHAIHRFHHQVHIDRRRHAMIAQRLTYHRPNGQIRYVVVIHHIEMHHIGTGRQHVVDLLAQPRKVSGEYRRGNQKILCSAHERVLE